MTRGSLDNTKVTNCSNGISDSSSKSSDDVNTNLRDTKKPLECSTKFVGRIVANDEIRSKVTDAFGNFIKRLSRHGWEHFVKGTFDCAHKLPERIHHIEKRLNKIFSTRRTIHLFNKFINANGSVLNFFL